MMLDATFQTRSDSGYIAICPTGISDGGFGNINKLTSKCSAEMVFHVIF